MHLIGFLFRYNFCPLTYLLPSEYVLFADEFKRNSSTGSSKSENVWIMKPIGKSQGKGIFLVNKLSHLSAWESSVGSVCEPYIIQKYIHNPLLIGGKKSDIRIYVLVTSYNPLTVYLYRNGFARFTHTRYDENRIHETEIHLTNVAVQKNCIGYDESKGGKWFLDKLKTYLMSKYGEPQVNDSFLKIEQIVIKTLESMCRVMTHDRQNSFELYGFDVMLDSHLHPWLIEVNGSPSMTANTAADWEMKTNLLKDALTIVDAEGFLSGNEEQVGGFDLICKKSARNEKQLVEKSKVSFLGSMINREQVYKKIARLSAPRLNTELVSKAKVNKNSTLPSTSGTTPLPASSNNANYGSGSQRATDYRRKVLSQQQNKNFSTQNPNPKVNIAFVDQEEQKMGPSKNTGIAVKKVSSYSSKNGGKDFIIKQKSPSIHNTLTAKRQNTNENDPEDLM